MQVEQPNVPVSTRKAAGWHKLQSTIYTPASRHEPMNCMLSAAAEMATTSKIGWMQNESFWIAQSPNRICRGVDAPSNSLSVRDKPGSPQRQCSQEHHQRALSRLNIGSISGHVCPLRQLLDLALVTRSSSQIKERCISGEFLHSVISKLFPISPMSNIESRS